MKPGRIACCVPFCRCTVPKDRHPGATEVICAKHWRLVPRALKARKRQTERREARMEAARGQGRGSPLAVPRARRLAWLAWDACKAAAIEIAAGITAAPSPRRNDHADR